MNKGVFNFILFAGILLLVSCAGKQQYEWIKVKLPNTSAKQFIPSDSIRRVNILVNLKEKSRVKYVENSHEFFDKYSIADVGEQLSSTNNQIRTEKYKKKNIFSDAAKNNKSDFIYEDNDFSASELNDALILPEKPAEIISDQAKAKAPFTNDLMSNNKDLSIKDVLVNTNRALKAELSPDKKSNFIWAGLILLVVGIIVGLIFRRYTFLISVSGVILMIIGYYLRI